MKINLFSKIKIENFPAPLSGTLEGFANLTDTHYGSSNYYILFWSGFISISSRPIYGCFEYCIHYEN